MAVSSRGVGGRRQQVIDAREIRAVQREIERAGKDFNKALRKALYEAGWAIGAASQEIVPVDEGVLKGSMEVTRPTARNPEVYISYGGPASAYAWYQHEGQREDGTHVVQNYSEPGKQKHYLTEPLEEEIATWPTGLVKRIRANL